MKRFAALFLALCVMCCAMPGSVDVARIAMAEPAEATEPTKAPVENNKEETPPVKDEKTQEPKEEKAETTPDPVTETPTPAATEINEPSATEGTETTPEPTEGEGATDAPDATQTPAGEENQVADATPTPEEENEASDEKQEPVIEGEGPVWIGIENGRRYGELKDIIPLVEEKDTIYLATTDVLKLDNYTVEALRAIKFAPDPEMFTKKSDVVIVSDLDPDGKAVENAIFLWVGNPDTAPEKPANPADELQLSDEEYSEIEIQVQKAQADNELPVFTLISVPELSESQRFAVIVDGDAPRALEGNTYAAVAAGELRFAVLDENSNVLAKSTKYKVEELTIADEPDDAQAAPDPTPIVDDGTDADTNDEIPVDEEGLDVTDGSADDALPIEGDLTEEQSEEEAAIEARTRAMVIEIEIGVNAIDYFPGETSDVAPTFVLSGKPAGDTYQYAVMTDGGDPVAIDGDRYTAKQDGDYTLRFAIVDAESNIVALSGKYSLSLDFTPPAATKKQAWMIDPDDSSKEIHGTLSGLLNQAPNGTTIYLTSGEVIALSGGAGRLAGIKLTPDPSAFSGSYSVKVSYTHPTTGATGSLYVWVADLSGSGGSTDEVELAVTAENYTPGAWTMIPPVFTLKQVPDTATGYNYAVIVDGGTPIRIDGDEFVADTEGKYTLTFALLNDLDQIAAQSADYDVAVDKTPPVLRVEVGEYDGRLTISVSDTLSDVIYISLDGGASWREAASLESGGLGLSQMLTKAYAANMIQAKDAAGNIAKYDQAIPYSGGWGGMGGFGGGGGGGDSRTVSHSSADDDATTAYNAVDLTTDGEEMSVLTLGGETLDLSIARAAADETFETVGDATFSVDLAAWNGSEEDAYDTLVLTATTGDNDEEYAFRWDFSGAVYKKLSASGIDYLVLRVGDRVTAISTAGFTGGMRYNLLKSNGISSKEFQYHVLMGVPQPELAMRVDVDGETYALSQDETSEIYYYDVLLGGPELMNKTFGA